MTQDQPAREQQDRDHEEDDQDREQLAVGDGLLDGEDRGEQHEDEDAADAHGDGDERLASGAVPRHTCVEERRDDEGDGAEWLHDDERGDPECTELADDRQPEHERADDPRGPGEQAAHLPQAQTRGGRRTAQSLDLGDASVLVLRAQRHEDSAGECQRDAEEEPGVAEGFDDLIAHLRHHEAPRTGHSRTLPAAAGD